MVFHWVPVANTRQDSNMTTQTRSIIGKTVTGVISRPAPGGGFTVVMLQFSDGSCFEFVSPAARRQLRQSQRPSREEPETAIPQLNMFPQDGDAAIAAA
jgi:hypothetical protein